MVLSFHFPRSSRSIRSGTQSSFHSEIQGRESPTRRWRLPKFHTTHRKQRRDIQLRTGIVRSTARPLYDGFTQLAGNMQETSRKSTAYKHSVAWNSAHRSVSRYALRFVPVRAFLIIVMAFPESLNVTSSMNVLISRRPRP